MLSTPHNPRQINNEADERFLKWQSKDFYDCHTSNILEPPCYIIFE